MTNQHDRSSMSFAPVAVAAAMTRHRQALEQQYEKLSHSLDADRAIGVETLTAALQELRQALQAMDIAEKELHTYDEQLISVQDERDHERKQYRELFQNCPAPYLVTDSDGIICEANLAALEFTTCTSEELIGFAIHKLVHPDEQDAIARRIAEMQRSRRTDTWELKLCPRGSAPIPVSISIVVCDQGDHKGELLWLLHDLTVLEQDRFEMQLLRDEIHRSERLTAIGMLAAGLDHDVRNLLLPMQWRLKSLAAADLPSPAVEDVEGLRNAIDSLKQLASKLQLMAEQSGPPQALEEITEIAAWWEQAAPLMRTATRTSVHVNAQLDRNLPPINIAPHLLTQAVMNLVNNASSVMTGGGFVTVSAQRSKHGPFVELSVNDQGPGMAPEVLRRALDSSLTTMPRDRGLSTGMGLSLVRSIVKSVAGSVRIDSTPGRGTSVILRLPAAPEPTRGEAEAAGYVRYAAVSVSDGHLASKMCTLLNLSRLPSWRCDPHDPGDCRLWIVEPASVSVEMAREYLRVDGTRRLILLGDKSEAWQEIPAVWINPTANLSTIRDTLSQVAFEVLQEQ